MSKSRIARHQLDNGLGVVLVPDDRVPIVALSLWYRVGTSHEPQGRSGFAHLFEHMMFQGSANVGKAEHFEIVEAVGGRTNAYTLLDATVYNETLPSHYLELALWLEADRLATLGTAMSQETLDNQREVVKNERRLRVDNIPYGPGEEKLFALAYPPEHPYHHSPWGSMDDLSAASLDDVRAFFETYYVPNNAVLTVVGDLDTEHALSLINRHFGQIPPAAGPPMLDGTAGMGPRTGAEEVVHDVVPLPRLWMGCVVPPLGSDAFQAADMLTDLLIGGRASRLQTRLVRELRLAQTVDAWAQPLVGGSALVILDVTVAAEADHRQLAEALDEELDRLAATSPRDEEMARVRLRRATTRASSGERVADQADQIGMYAGLLSSPELFYTQGERDEATTADAISACVRDWLAPANRASVWYLPADA
jgi:predicted Zn-dependent peptidase